ncbi:Sulfotransferase family cytosolic 1B member 1 [Tetrabaena socialis]|uniref:Sulfotransferase n=1 Tax=Tetrabaena socialis TaxID=47790 RepID=A0A2J8ABG0_9CHLO|nr:Sulfotransferase family cytosolic 1B member 1 [Tetrabaena socialis]|eukprot:PNH09859.1 Sulfotransferase family cytosolic 1B member 1 [Tetrabaena socialis]
MPWQVWRRLRFRPDDIVIASWAKSGTTLTQQLVGQLITGGSAELATGDASPWLDMRVMPPNTLELLEAQSHRRFIKTHLPTTALPYDPNATDAWYDSLNNTPGLVGPPIPRADPDPRAYFLNWLRKDGAPFWPFFSHMRGWWNVRQLPNVLLVHFNNLRADLKGEGRRIADFLGIQVDEERWPAILEHCSMDWMRAHPDKVNSTLEAIWQDGINDFVFKGTNGRWRDTLTAEDCAEYEQAARQALGEECAAWLQTADPLDPRNVA